MFFFLFAGIKIVINKFKKIYNNLNKNCSFLYVLTLYDSFSFFSSPSIYSLNVVLKSPAV